MSITASQVAQLREKTGVSMMAVKNALTEANGDEEKAIEILRKRGEAKSGEKAERSTKEGVVTISVRGNKGTIASVRCETDFVARNDDFKKLAKDFCETGKTSGLDDAVKGAVNKLGENIQLGEWLDIEAPVLGSYVHSTGKIGVIIGLDKGTEEQARNVAMHAAAMNPRVKYPEEVSSDLIAKEKEIWTEQLKKEGKPADKIPMIMAGKEKKFREEAALASQTFVKDNSMTVDKYLNGAKILAYVRLGI